MKRKVFNIIKIILSLITVPLIFVKMFVGVGYLPSENRVELLKTYFYHSIFENISDLISPIFAYATIAFAIVSASVNVIAVLRPNDKKISVISNIAFIVVMVAFIGLALVASTVARGY